MPTEPTEKRGERETPMTQDDDCNLCPFCGSHNEAQLAAKDEVIAALHEEHANDQKDEVKAAAGEKGGRARAEVLSPQERSEIASKAAAVRWGSQVSPIKRATNEGPLKVGDLTIDAAVIEGGIRVVSEQKFMAALGMYRSGALSIRRKASDDGGAPIPLFLAHKNLKPYADKHLGGVHFEPLKYRTMKGNIAHGIRADIIPKICEMWIDADRDGVLGARQKVIAAKADILLRGLAHVGIIALIDEATGFQEIRDREALQAILDHYLRAEYAKWAKRFPDDFYREIFRLRGWEWHGMKVNRPQVVAKYTTDIVYARLAPGWAGRSAVFTNRRRSTFTPLVEHENRMTREPSNN